MASSTNGHAVASTRPAFVRCKRSGCAFASARPRIGSARLALPQQAGRDDAALFVLPCGRLTRRASLPCHAVRDLNGLLLCPAEFPRQAERMQHGIHRFPAPPQLIARPRAYQQTPIRRGRQVITLSELCSVRRFLSQPKGWLEEIHEPPQDRTQTRPCCRGFQNFKAIIADNVPDQGVALLHDPGLVVLAI